MTQHERFDGLLDVVRKKPLQAGKFVSILLTLVLGAGGFFRILDAKAVLGDSLLGDGQFLVLIGIPLVSLGLVFVVFVETLVAGYRLFRSDESTRDTLTGRSGYLLIRGAEAAFAIVGVTIIITAIPPLFAESTPAPAGVGIMLLLAVVGGGILLVSFVRATAELVVYGNTA